MNTWVHHVNIIDTHSQKQKQSGITKKCKPRIAHKNTNLTSLKTDIPQPRNTHNGNKNAQTKHKNTEEKHKDYPKNTHKHTRELAGPHKRKKKS